MALAPVGERHTAFTGELIRALRDGDPTYPAQLSLNDIYDRLCRTLSKQGLPSRAASRPAEPASSC